MSNSLFGQASGAHSNDEGGIIKAIKYIGEQNLPLVKRLELISFILLPQLYALRLNGGDKKIVEAAAAVYGAVTVFGEAEFAMASAVIQGLDREKVKRFVDNALANVDYENALRKAQSDKDMVRSLTKREHVALSVAFNEILPPGFRAFMDIIGGRDKRSVPARTTQWFENVKEKSVVQLAQDRIEAAQNFPVDAFVDAIMEIAQKTSPERLATMASYFTKNVSTTDLEQLGLSGITFAQEFMQAATEGNPFRMKPSTHVGIFGAQLKHILNVVEKALIEAGLTLDKPKLITALNQARRKTAGGDGGPTAPAPFGT